MAFEAGAQLSKCIMSYGFRIVYLCNRLHAPETKTKKAAEDKKTEPKSTWPAKVKIKIVEEDDKNT